jgi:peptidoglycan/LPS O-acetylase OafA/YrhL
MRYRPEIDGLRAVAVIPVILFHANPGLLPGGYVGVDVFFVISGYLICSILLEDLAAGRFSLLRFYERRVRRIAPALLLVCLACLPFAALWMLPSELSRFGRSLLNALLMVSNFELWDDVGYFAPKSELKPLLHTWTLSVEEQFYLVFPLMLFFLRRCSDRTGFLVIGAVALASFALTWPMARLDPIGNFYLPFTRFFELALGALLAIHGVDRIALPARLRAGLAMTGLVAIIGSCFLFSSIPHYPGPLTLVPCLGALLVIAFGSDDSLAGRLLRLRPVVGIGLISYSLYLWHQPVFAFARLRSLEDLSPAAYSLLIALIFGLSICSYLLVERPFRNVRRFGRRSLFVLSGSLASLLIATSIVFSSTHGFRSRDPGLAAIREISFGIAEACNGQILPECATGPKPTMAVLGDSFAMHLVDGLKASMPEDGGGLMQLHMGKCAFIETLAPVLPDMAEAWPLDCMRHTAKVKAFLAATPSFRTVVVASQFRTYLQDYQLMTPEGEVIETDYQRVLEAVEATLERLRQQGLKPVVFAPPPRSGRDAGLCLSRTRLLGLSNDICALQRPEQRRYDAMASRLMADLARRFPVASLENYLCDEQRCRVVDAGVPLYRDDGHLSRQGSIHLGRSLHLFTALQGIAERGCMPGPGEPRGVCPLQPDQAAGSF